MTSWIVRSPGRLSSQASITYTLGPSSGAESIIANVDGLGMVLETPQVR